MSRKKLTTKLVQHKFEHFTDDVRIKIAEIVTKNRCDDVSDTVIDGLWAACPDTIEQILEDEDLRPISSAGSVVDELSSEMRDKIRLYIDQALSYEAELGDLSHDAFEDKFRANFAPIVKEERDYYRHRAEHNDRWAFFNLPDAEADYPRWIKRWLTPAQAVALSFGKDPNQVNSSTLGNLRQIGGSPFRDEFNDRLKVVEAAVEASQLSVPISVSEFALWADSRGIRLPPDLICNSSPKIEGDAAFWKNKYETAQAELDKVRFDLKPLSTGLKRSLYRLILGMAISRYEYRTDQRSSAANNIMKDLEDIDISLSDDSIRDHLSEAARDLDFTWTTPRRWRGER